MALDTIFGCPECGKSTQRVGDTVFTRNFMSRNADKIGAMLVLQATKRTRYYNNSGSKHIL